MRLKRMIVRVFEAVLFSCYSLFDSFFGDPQWCFYQIAASGIAEQVLSLNKLIVNLIQSVVWLNRSLLDMGAVNLLFVNISQQVAVFVIRPCRSRWYPTGEPRLLQSYHRIDMSVIKVDFGMLAYRSGGSLHKLIIPAPRFKLSFGIQIYHLSSLNEIGF